MSAIGDAERAYTPHMAMRVSGASRRQIDYWADVGSVVPSVDRRVGRHRRVRLWGFQELVELTIVVKLRERGASLQSIRGLVGYLRRQEAMSRPLSQVTFGVDRETGEVYWRDEDGNMSSAGRPAELVLDELLDLEEIKREIRSARVRDRSEVGRLRQRRGLLGNQPGFAGTRTPVSALRPYVEREYSDDEILEAFPHLDRKDIEVARRSFATAS